MQVVPVRHPGRWVAAAVVCLLAAMAVHSLFFSNVKRDGVTEERFEWNVINHYFFSTGVLEGLGITLALTAAAMVGGILLGVLLSIMRLSPNPIVTGSSWVYIWFFRGTPVLVQLLFWYNARLHLSQFQPRRPVWPRPCSFQPQLMVDAVRGRMHRAGSQRRRLHGGDNPGRDYLGRRGANRGGPIAGDVAAVGLAPHRVAAGDASSHPADGQRDHLDAEDVVARLRCVAPELLFRVEQIYAANYYVIPLLMVASLQYLWVTSVLMVGQYYLERHYARGRRPPAPTNAITAAEALAAHPSGRAQDRQVGPPARPVPARDGYPHE